jgi:hypothetical protein
VTANRDEIRDHLAAVIEAARELPKDDRSYLADTFLDDLESRYQLVPRSNDGRQRPVRSGPTWLSGFPGGWSPLRLGLMVLLALIVVPAALGLLIHPPILVLIIVLLLVFRSGARRGPRWRGPRGRMIV